MFCPKCATQNVEGAHFCRSCGANISLIPQALTGQLPVPAADDSTRRGRRKHRHHEPSLDEGIRNLMMGLGFVAVALALGFFGRLGAQFWWFWLLLPAFAMLGRGISEIVRARQLKTSTSTTQPRLTYVAPPESLPASKTAELRPPVASVTEGTTRHLGAEAPTRHSDSWENQKPS